MQGNAEITSSNVQGAVAPAFEPVRQLFEHEMVTMAERQAQLCVYYRGEKVVDVWADMTGQDDFTPDTLINVFSSGKSLESVAVACLVGKGLLRYDAKIVDYWPEFGANGKEGLTVADLMRHEAGLANFDTSIDMEDLFAENLKQNTIGQLIERHALNYENAGVGGKREYHALTRGWIVNELFRRVEPSGRTIGEFLREEVSGPLNADVVIGVNEEELTRTKPVKTLGFGYQILQSLVPKFLGRKIVHNFIQIARRLLVLLPSMLKGRKNGPPPPIAGTKDFNFFNDPKMRRGETPSANANCSARGLAKYAAMLAAGGSVDGKEYMTREAWQALHDHPVEAYLGALLPTRFTQGGVDTFMPCSGSTPRMEREFNEGREGFYGWMGFGGSIFQWNPEKEIGFAFVPTSLHWLDLLNERGKRYQAEVLKCVDSVEQGGSGS